MLIITISGSLNLISVAIYGAYQGSGGDFDTLSWGFSLAVLAMACQFTAHIFFILRLRKIRDDKVNQTPLISPASSTLSLDMENEMVQPTIEPDIPLRMRVNSFCPSEQEYTPLGANKDRSFSFDGVPDIFHYEDA